MDKGQFKIGDEKMAIGGGGVDVMFLGLLNPVSVLFCFSLFSLKCIRGLASISRNILLPERWSRFTFVQQ